MLPAHALLLSGDRFGRRFDRRTWFINEIMVHESQLRGYLRRFLRRSGDLADGIQETYARLLSLPDESLALIRLPHAFLFTTARHVAVDLARRHRIVFDRVVGQSDFANLLDERPSAYEELNGMQELALLAGAIESLPERCRQVLVLRKLRGLSQKAIAVQLGISENTVEKHAAKAVRQCAAYLEAWQSRKFVSSGRMAGEPTTPSYKCGQQV